MNVQHVSPMVIWATGAGIMGLMFGIISWQRKHFGSKPMHQQLDHNQYPADAIMEVDEMIVRPVETSGVVVVHLKADDDRPYQGYELLQALLSAGFRFGKAQIFHYHESTQGDDMSERTVFSVASMQKPGTFDIDVMGGCRCPGLTLLMSLKGKPHPVKDFTLMMDAAASLLEDLGGVMLSEDRKPMSEVAYRRLVERMQQGHVATADC